MSKLKLIDISYCGGETRDNKCSKRLECKRYIKHYNVEVQCLWFVSADDCLRTEYNHFLKLNVKDGYKKLNEVLGVQE